MLSRKFRGLFLFPTAADLAPAPSCAIIAAMEIDSYWRTRTIAEAQAQGYSHLRATCPSCGRIADVPWPLLIDRKGTNRNTFLGNIPLKCQRRDTTPTIRVSHSSNALVICDYYRSSRYHIVILCLRFF